MKCNVSALLLAVFSGICLTAYSFCFKRLDDRVQIGSILIVRGLFEFLFPALVALTIKTPIKPKTFIKDTDKSMIKFYIRMAFVALLSSLRLVLIFMSLWTLPMTSLHAVINCTPIVVLVLGAFASEEAFTKVNVFCVVLLTAGISLYFGPDVYKNIESGNGSGNELLVGLGFALAALLFTSMVSILCRKVKKRTSTWWITSYTGLAIFSK